MECSCNIDVDTDGYGPSCYMKRFRVSRKTHECCECHRQIERGEKYEYISGVWDGRPDSYKTCNDCKSLRDVFFTNYYFGMIWDDFRDGLSDCGYTVPEKSLAKLTPSARAKVCELIEDHWNMEEYDE